MIQLQMDKCWVKHGSSSKRKLCFDWCVSGSSLCVNQCNSALINSFICIVFGFVHSGTFLSEFIPFLLGEKWNSMCKRKSLTDKVSLTMRWESVQDVERELEVQIGMKQ